MQFVPVEHPIPLPFILFAEASVVKIGAGIDRLRIANAIEANPAIIHFIGHPPNVQCFKNAMLGPD